MSPVSIRSATKQDAPAIFRFLCTLEETSFDYSLFERLYYKNLEDEDKHYLLAEYEQEPIGYVSCHGQILLHHLGKVFEIQELFVDTRYRSLGTGKLLVQELEKRLQHEDYQSLEVTPNLARTRALEFYLACGFQLTHHKLTKTK